MLRVILHDPTSWIYIISLTIALYGAGLFSWWWIKLKGASSVFMYVTFIFLGEAFESALSLQARTFHVLNDYDGYSSFVGSWLWPGRKFLTIMALTAIVVHMSLRIIARVKTGRRETD